MLLTWGFTPKVLGYIPNVRGVITGLADLARFDESRRHGSTNVGHGYTHSTGDVFAQACEPKVRTSLCFARPSPESRVE